MSRIRFVLVVLFALSLVAVACGTESSTDTSGSAGDTPSGDTSSGDTSSGDAAADPAAGTCPVGTPDCNDTPGDLQTPEPGAGTSSGMLVDGGLTVEEALSRTPADGIIAVKGVVYIDEFGTFLCGELADSAPPQCGGGALEVIGLNVDQLGVAIQEMDGVSWSDETISALGTVDNGVLTVDPTAA